MLALSTPATNPFPQESSYCELPEILVSILEKEIGTLVSAVHPEKIRLMLAINRKVLDALSRVPQNCDLLKFQQILERSERIQTTCENFLRHFECLFSFDKQQQTMQAIVSSVCHIASNCKQQYLIMNPKWLGQQEDALEQNLYAFQNLIDKLREKLFQLDGKTLGIMLTAIHITIIAIKQFLECFELHPKLIQSLLTTFENVLNILSPEISATQSILETLEDLREAFLRQQNPVARSYL